MCLRTRKTDVTENEYKNRDNLFLFKILLYKTEKYLENRN